MGLPEANFYLKHPYGHESAQLRQRMLLGQSHTVSPRQISCGQTNRVFEEVGLRAQSDFFLHFPNVAGSN